MSGKNLKDGGAKMFGNKKAPATEKKPTPKREDDNSPEKQALSRDERQKKRQKFQDELAKLTTPEASDEEELNLTQGSE